MFILHTLSCCCPVPHLLSETEPTLQGLLKSSSTESILQVRETKPPVGLVFLVRNELEADVLQKTIFYIISFSSTFGEGEGLHQAAFTDGDCLQIPCSWARTLSFILMNSKSFLWQELVEKKQNEQECLILAIKKKELGCRGRDSKSLQNHYVTVTDAVYLVLGLKDIHRGTEMSGRGSCTAEGSRMLQVVQKAG